MFLRTPHAIDEWVAGDFRADHKLGCTRPRSERALCLYQSRAKGVETCCAHFAQSLPASAVILRPRDILTVYRYQPFVEPARVMLVPVVADGSSPWKRKRYARVVARTRASPSLPPDELSDLNGFIDQVVYEAGRASSTTPRSSTRSVHLFRPTSATLSH